MEPKSRRVAGSNGIDLHLLEWSQEGVPLVLVHGFGNDAHIWDDFAPVAAPHYRVLALDLRGHGDSAWPLHAEYEYAHHVADLEAVLDGLGIERLVLVGHSLGGRVAMLFAGVHPERMAGLVIVDSAPAPWPVNLPETSVTSRSPVAARSSSDPASASAYVPAGRLIVSSPGVLLAWMTRKVTLSSEFVRSLARKPSFQPQWIYMVMFHGDWHKTAT